MSDDDFEESNFRMVKGLPNMIDLANSSSARKKRNSTSVDSTQSLVKKRARFSLLRSSLSIDDDDLDSLKIDHRYSMLI